MIQAVVPRTDLTSVNSAVVPGSNFAWFHKHFDGRLPLLNSPYVFLVKLDRPLSDIFLEAMPDAGNRQWYNCSTCKRVIDTLGRAVMVDEITGELTPIFWMLHSAEDSDDVDRAYWKTVLDTLCQYVRRGEIVDVIDNIYSDHLVQSKGAYVFGAPQRGIRNAETQERWRHVSAVIPKRKLRTGIPEQRRMLEEQVDFFAGDVLGRALTLMENDDQLSSRKKHVKTLRDFVEMNNSFNAVKHIKYRDNLMWRVATVENANFNHFTNVTVGQYVASVKAGTEAVGKAYFLSQTKPENYLRATEAPKEGNVQEATRIVADLGVEKALVNRRMATVDDIVAWEWRKSVTKSEATESIFAGLAKPKDTSVSATKPTFNKVVLAKDFIAEYVVGKSNELINIAVVMPGITKVLAAYTVAADPDDGIIYRWDLPERRNTVAQYTYVAEVPHAWFGVTSNKRYDVEGIVRSDIESWFSTEPTTDFKLLVRSGTHHECCLCLFANTLRHELHAVRSTMEALMTKHQGAKLPEGVTGITLVPGIQLLVETKQAIFNIKIGDVR